MRVVIGVRDVVIEWLAYDIANNVRALTGSGDRRAIVLPTGRTYEGEDGVYAQFAGLIRGEGIDLTDFPFFNMDAYLRREGHKLRLLETSDPVGYQSYMKTELFDPLGITPRNHNFPAPDPNASQHRRGSACTSYTNDLIDIGFARRV